MYKNSVSSFNRSRHILGGIKISSWSHDHNHAPLGGDMSS